MIIRQATLEDKNTVLNLLDEFRTDCIRQITGKDEVSNSAKEGGSELYEGLIAREDYCALLLIDEINDIVGILTGYLCPMMRSGQMRAEIEEFYIKPSERGGGGAQLLMDAFFEWCKSKGVKKVNLESENELSRAHKFYEKYGFESKAKRFVMKVSV